MNIWHDIDPARITPKDFIAYIEITKGQKQKYELDKETGMLILDRVLDSSDCCRTIFSAGGTDPQETPGRIFS